MSNTGFTVSGAAVSRDTSCDGSRKEEFVIGVIFVC